MSAYDVAWTNLPNFLKEETTFFIPCFILLEYALFYFQLARIQNWDFLAILLNRKQLLKNK